MRTRERLRLQGSEALRLDGDETPSSLALDQRDPTIRAYVEHFQVRALAEAFLSTKAAQLRWQADVFEWARPKADDYNGRATREQLHARWHRLTEQAKALRAAAEVALLQGDGLTADELAGFTVRATS